MAFAQNLHDVVENKAEIKRSFTFTNGRGDFPDTAGSHSQLGFECFARRGATLCGIMARGNNEWLI
jgi:hypothetical protein